MQSKSETPKREIPYELKVFSWGVLCCIAGAMFIGSYAREATWMFAFVGGAVAGAVVTMLYLSWRYR